MAVFAKQDDGIQPLKLTKEHGVIQMMHAESTVKNAFAAVNATMVVTLDNSAADLCPVGRL